MNCATLNDAIKDILDVLYRLDLFIYNISIEYKLERDGDFTHNCDIIVTVGLNPDKFNCVDYSGTEDSDIDIQFDYSIDNQWLMLEFFPLFIMDDEYNTEFESDDLDKPNAKNIYNYIMCMLKSKNDKLHRSVKENTYAISKLKEDIEVFEKYYSPKVIEENTEEKKSHVTQIKLTKKQMSDALKRATNNAKYWAVWKDPGPPNNIKDE